MTISNRKRRAYKTNAACKKGCAFCCTGAGSIHITTFEGRITGTPWLRLTRQRRMALQKCADERHEKARSGLGPSPVPSDEKQGLHDLTPSDRLSAAGSYSTRTCTKGTPPILSRAGDGISGPHHPRSTRRPWTNTGLFFGHLSYILYMLEPAKIPRHLPIGRFQARGDCGFRQQRHGTLFNRMAGG